MHVVSLALLRGVQAKSWSPDVQNTPWAGRNAPRVHRSGSMMPRLSISSLNINTNHQRQRWENRDKTLQVRLQAFSLFRSVWRLFSNLVPAFSADDHFLLFSLFSIFRTAVTFFFSFNVGPLWCNYFGVHRNKHQNTFLVVESFPSPETQTFHPICWFCFCSCSFSFVKHLLDSQWELFCLTDTL